MLASQDADEKAITKLLTSDDADVRLAGLIAIDVACYENFPTKKAALEALAKALENPGKLDHQLLLTVAQLDGDASIVPALEKLIARDDLPTATVAKAVLVLKAKAGGSLANSEAQRRRGQTAHRGRREGLAQDRVAGRSARHLRVPRIRRPDAVRLEADRRPVAFDQQGPAAGGPHAGAALRTEGVVLGRAAVAERAESEDEVRGRDRVHCRRSPASSAPSRTASVGEAAATTTIRSCGWKRALVADICPADTKWPTICDRSRTAACSQGRRQCRGNVVVHVLHQPVGPKSRIETAWPRETDKDKSHEPRPQGTRRHARRRPHQAGRDGPASLRAQRLHQVPHDGDATTPLAPSLKGIARAEGRLPDRIGPVSVEDHQDRLRDGDRSNSRTARRSPAWSRTTASSCAS